MELARCEYIQRRENVIAVGPAPEDMALGLGLAACQNVGGFHHRRRIGPRVDGGQGRRRLLNLQRQLSRLNLLIIDELGFVPLSRTGAELLFEVFSQRYERGSILVTTNLPFDEWTEVFGSERLTGALLDRLTHHVHILEMNGESYRLKRSRAGDTPVSTPTGPATTTRIPLLDTTSSRPYTGTMNHGGGATINTSVPRTKRKTG